MARKKRTASKITIKTLDGEIKAVVNPGAFYKPKTRRARMRVARRTPHWKRVRVEALIRDDRRCTRCGSQEKLEVHHLTYVRLGRELLEDLVTLCQCCHATEHKWNRSGRGLG